MELSSISGEGGWHRRCAKGAAGEAEMSPGELEEVIMGHGKGFKIAMWDYLQACCAKKKALNLAFVRCQIHICYMNE